MSYAIHRQRLHGPSETAKRNMLKSVKGFEKVRA